MMSEKIDTVEAPESEKWFYSGFGFLTGRLHNVINDEINTKLGGQTKHLNECLIKFLN